MDKASNRCYLSLHMYELFRNRLFVSLLEIPQKLRSIENTIHSTCVEGLLSRKCHLLPFFPLKKKHRKCFYNLEPLNKTTITQKLVTKVKLENDPIYKIWFDNSARVQFIIPALTVPDIPE